MSSIVNMDIALIASTKVLPKEEAVRIFYECINELNGNIRNKDLFIENEFIGHLTINDRIILSFEDRVDNNKRSILRNKLRETFTKRSSLASQNYLYELKKEKEKMEQSSLVEEELQASINKKIKETENAIQRQTLSECEAIKLELIDAAIAQGYEVVEENNQEGIQLQFIRREY